jgi:hypothetical protein
VPRGSHLRHYCTYFDARYLTRGLVLYESLRRHAQPFCLWVLCMEAQTQAVLERLALPGLRPVSHEVFARGDAPLAAARLGRSRAEYYFTCTPSWLRYILAWHPEIDQLTYLDADLCFFASPEPLFDELGAASIQLIEHRFPPRLQHLKAYGRFNVGWISVRRNEEGLGFVDWWRERCLEWCFHRLEDGRYADQGYLDQVPSRFRAVNIVQHPGANLALWNLEHVTLTGTGERILVNGRPLLFFHFHNLREIGSGWYSAGADLYELTLPPTVRRRIYAPYLVALSSMRRMLSGSTNLLVSATSKQGFAALVYRLRFHRSLVVVGKSVIDVDVMGVFGAAARVWRPLKLALRRAQRD